ncbi:MAG: hypothetical protein IV085_06450 [Thiobacillus sp.]|nr:hypothetical protein [Thiobacillus sp.]
MKPAAYSFVGFVCLCMLPSVVFAQRELISAESGRVAPLVESVVNDFQILLRESTIIVLSTDGDEQREMAKLGAFLKSRNVVEDAPQIMASVRKQLRRDKTGFSHPIWLTDHSAKGNACVLAVRQNESGAPAALVSKKIGDALISGKRLKQTDGDVIQASIIAHEMYHCYEYLRAPMTAFWEDAMRSRLTYAMHRSESAADAFAALYVLQNYDAVDTVRMLMEFRRIGMLNSDVEHNTARTVEHVLTAHNNRLLPRMAPGRLVLMAEDIRNEKVMDENTFVALKKSSIEITGAYINLLPESGGLNLKHEKAQLLSEKLALMDDAPQNVRMTAYVMNEISGSLHKIGARTATSSKYFQPLMERYTRKPIPM